MGERSIDRVVRRAREIGLSDVEAARAIGVEKQVFSNWKRRGLPPAMYQRAADFIGCTVDELLGRRVPGEAPLHGYGLAPEGAHIGAEWQKLHEPLRTQIAVLIETLVAHQVRDSRKALQRARTEDRPIRGT